MRSIVVMILLFKATVDADDCLTTPCENGGICTNPTGSYTCDCTGTGYIGATCEIDIDECPSMPCDNGGICTNLPGSFTCDCTGTGYEGAMCTSDIDECPSTPCDNGGVCFNMPGSFMCDCTGNGYEGATCTIDIDECPSMPCDNGGVCTNMPGSFSCDCTGTGYEGATCITDVNECDSTPCQNGGVCLNTEGSFTCDCSAIGYMGPTCANEPACTCSIHGDPHIKTFDEQKINYQGVCVFKFAELVKAGCSVLVRFKTARRDGHPKAAYVEEIYVTIGGSGDEIVIGQDKQITVNGVSRTAVYPGLDYVIQQDNDFIVVSTTCGMTAMYDGIKTAKVIIDEEDGDNVSGICGDCNGVPDDLKKSDGTDVSNEKDKFKKIGNSYALPPLDDCTLPATSD